MHGTATSEVEVTHISSNGIWLLLEDKEFFLPYVDFPWFQNARLAEIQDVELQHGFHLHWPKLDVDLAVEQIADPVNFPLISGTSEEASPK